MNKKFEAVKGEVKKLADSWAREIVFSVFGAADAFEAYFNQKYFNYDITKRGIAILHVIILNNGELPQNRIAKIINRTRQAVAQVLANLEKRGLITREIIDLDRRKRIVKITNEGLRIIKGCLPTSNHFYNCIMSSISKSDGERLIKILESLRSGIDRDMERYNESKRMGKS